MSREIIDSQVHVWGTSTAARPWPQGTVAHRAQPFGVDDLIPEMDRAGIAAAVLVPPSWEGDRNDVAFAAVQRYPGRFCVMGRLPLTVPMSSEELTEWHSQPGMLGARLTFNRDPGPLTNGSIEWLWDAAERVHLPIMLFARTRHMLSLTSPSDIQNCVSSSTTVAFRWVCQTLRNSVVFYMTSRRWHGMPILRSNYQPCPVIRRRDTHLRVSTMASPRS